MSKALKCNRCCKCFDPIDVGRSGADEQFTHIPEVYLHNNRTYSEHEYLWRDGDIHLCPDCSNAFWAFMDMKEPEDYLKTEEEEIDLDEEAVDKAIEDLKKVSKGVLLGYILASRDCHCANASMGEDGRNADKGTTGGVSEGDGKAPKRASRAKKVGE